MALAPEPGRTGVAVGPCQLAPQSYFRCTIREIKHEKFHSGRRLSSLSPRTRALVLAQWLFNPMKHLRLSPEE